MIIIVTMSSTITLTRKRSGRASKVHASAIANKALLANAWKRILSSKQIQYKNFQRLEIQAYGTAAGALLGLIYDQLLSETYEPQPAYKVHLPKSQYTNRTLTLLSIPDWIVYTAIVTLIAEATMPREQDLYNKALFSNVPLSYISGRPDRFFKDWRFQYGRFNKASKRHVAQGYPFLYEFDIASFYDLIDHDLLFEVIRKYFNDTYALQLLEHMLQTWNSSEGILGFSHGIPQGVEASGFLADLFLYSLDRHMMAYSKTCRLARYVDDIRVFCSTKRRANAVAVHLEEEIKKLGLVPNVKRPDIIDARVNLDWLKEETSEALALTTDFRWRQIRPKSIQKLRHLKAKKTFMANCKTEQESPKNIYLTRLSLPKLLPDREVIQRIIEVYEERPDLYDLFFMYFRECKDMPELSRFCWKQLRRVPIRDWECANLLEVAIRNKLAPLNKPQTQILKQYMENNSMPLSASVAAGIIFSESLMAPVAHVTCKLPTQALYVGHWLVPILRLYKRRRVIKSSIRATVRRLLTSDDSRTSFITSYLIATRFNVAAVSSLPEPKSPYARHLLKNLGLTTINPNVDEIAPLLARMFRVKTPLGFDFRIKLGLFDPALYERALRHLQLASWYVHTHPTHFVNYIHNFNHVLLHFVLHKGNFVSKPIPWKHTFGQLNNAQFKTTFPTLAHVFHLCSQARNTNLSSHPYDEVHSRFTKLVTYPQQGKLISQLRAAYKEFIAKA